MDEFNLHLTGDIHAITAANNLLAAQVKLMASNLSMANIVSVWRDLINVLAVISD